MIWCIVNQVILFTCRTKTNPVERAMDAVFIPGDFYSFVICYFRFQNRVRCLSPLVTREWEISQLRIAKLEVEITFFGPVGFKVVLRWSKEEHFHHQHSSLLLLPNWQKVLQLCHVKIPSSIPSL